MPKFDLFVATRFVNRIALAFCALLVAYLVLSIFNVTVGNIQNGLGDESHRMLIALTRLMQGNFNFPLYQWTMSPWPPGYEVLTVLLMSIAKAIGLSPILFVNYVSIASYAFCIFAVYRITERIAERTFGILSSVAFASIPVVIEIHHTFLSEIPSTALVLGSYLISMTINRNSPPSLQTCIRAAASGVLILLATTLRSEAIFFGIAVFLSLLLWSHYRTALIYGVFASFYTVTKIAWNIALVAPEDRFFNYTKTHFNFDGPFVLAWFLEKLIQKNSAMFFLVALMLVMSIALAVYMATTRVLKKNAYYSGQEEGIREMLQLVWVSAFPFVLLLVFMFTGSVQSHTRYAVPYLPFIIASAFTFAGWSFRHALPMRALNGTIIGVGIVLLVCSLSSYRSFYNHTFRFSATELKLVEFLRVRTNNSFVLDFMAFHEFPITLYSIEPDSPIRAWNYAYPPVRKFRLPTYLMTDVTRAADRITAQGYLHLKTVPGAYLVLTHGRLWQKVSQMRLLEYHYSHSYFRSLINGIGHDSVTMQAPAGFEGIIRLQKVYENQDFLVYQVQDTSPTS